MKTKVAFLILHAAFLIFNSAFAQVTFQKTYGVHTKDAMFKVAKTSDGGYVLAGTTESFGSLPQDIYLVKVDATGAHQWSVVYGGIGSDFVISIVQTSDNGFLMAGGTSSFGSGGDDALLIKTDFTGAPQWSKVYGGSLDEYFLSAIQTSDGGFIAVGNTLSYGAGSNDILVVRTN